MLRALIFLIKAALVTAIVVWVANLEGTVRLNWTDMGGNDIAVNVNLGLFLLTLLGIILLSLLLFRVFKGFADFPKSWKRYKQITNKDKGLRALTLGLTAVAAGDTKAAVYQAFRADKLLPEENALSLLLKAQAARLDGREEDANAHFMHLLENKDASFLGMRGLLQSALDRKDYNSALIIAREALKLHPRQPWILQVTYDLEIRQRDMDLALKTLYRAEKAGAIDKEKAAGDRIAMLLYLADEELEKGNPAAAKPKLEKAYRYNETFIPTVTRLARYYIQNGKRTKAVQIIEKAWKTNTHPDLVPLWESAMPKPRQKKDENLERLKWFERLQSVRTGSYQGNLAVARAALALGMWGEARHYLKNAENIKEGKTVYQLFAVLEEKSGKSAEIVQEYLRKAADAPPERSWLCKETGHLYSVWSAYAPPHNAFNTIIWGQPFIQDETILISSHIGEENAIPATLEAPKAENI